MHFHGETKLMQIKQLKASLGSNILVKNKLLGSIKDKCTTLC